jgi:hypothetical protein
MNNFINKSGLKNHNFFSYLFSFFLLLSIVGKPIYAEEMCGSIHSDNENIQLAIDGVCSVFKHIRKIVDQGFDKYNIIASNKWSQINVLENNAIKDIKLIMQNNSKNIDLQVEQIDSIKTMVVIDSINIETDFLKALSKHIVETGCDIQYKSSRRKHQGSDYTEYKSKQHDLYNELIEVISSIGIDTRETYYHVYSDMAKLSLETAITTACRHPDMPNIEEEIYKFVQNYIAFKIEAQKFMPN